MLLSLPQKRKICSKLDYGYDAYSSGIPIVLNEGLGSYTGAFRSSTVESLYAETGKPPHSYHRDYMNLIYYTRLQMIPTSRFFSTHLRIADPMVGECETLWNISI